MQSVFAILLLLCLAFRNSAQVAPDFTITDVNGVEHNLYETLNTVHTVIINFFFLGCEPCAYYLPDLQALEDAYGAASGGGLEIWVISKQDESADLSAFSLDNDYGFYFFGVDGGAFDVVQDFEAIYDTLFYPNFTVVCPDASTHFDIWPVTDGLWEVESEVLQCNYGVAIRDVSKEKLSLYPNPVGPTLYFDGAGMESIAISDMQGRTVIETADPGNAVSVEGLMPGVYLFAGITPGGTIFTSLFLKNKNPRSGVFI